MDQFNLNILMNLTNKDGNTSFGDLLKNYRNYVVENTEMNSENKQEIDVLNELMRKYSNLDLIDETDETDVTD